MIIVKLQGGLGNQLFQYAIGKKLSLYHNVPLKLDTAALSTSDITVTPRVLELGWLNTHLSIATAAEVDLFANKTGFFHRVRKYITGARFIAEKSFRYNPLFLEYGKNCYLSGFWQCEKYFSDISGIIKKEFSLKQAPDEKNRQMLSLIQNSNAVSIHIRRGDYVHNKMAHAFHGVCSPEYYQKAIAYIGQKVSSPHFFIFSDDTEWASDNFSIAYPSTIVNVNDAGKGALDMHLMKNCKHHIIANSSFSWWGAWLCDHQDKIVTGPSQWFINPTADTADILPAAWYKI